MATSVGTVIKSFVSAIDFLDQRDIDPKLYDQSNDRDFTDFMKVIGGYKPAKMFNYHNFVDQDAYETCTISSVSTTGLAQITFTVNTGSGFPKAGLLLKTSNSNNAGKQARIQSITYGSGTATIVARSVGGNSAPIYATVGDVVTFGSNAYAEKSTAPANTRYSVTKYYNLIQKFRDVDEITDVQKVAKIETDISMLAYQTIKKLIKLKGDISYQMLAGVQSTTQFGDANPFLADATSGLPIQTTGGLDWYVTTYGISDQSGVLGTFGFTELDDMVDNWIANKAPNRQRGYMASRPYGLLSKFFKNLGSSGVTSVRIVIAGRSFDFEVEEILYRGFTMQLVHLPLLDHPQWFSATLNPEINGAIYWVPMDDIDTLEGGRSKRMNIRHTPTPFMGSSGNKSADGIITEWRTGALAEVPTNDDLYLRTNWETSQGLECLGVKHFQKYRVI